MAREKKPEEAPAGAPAWMATFSDLVTLLMCFFVLLYAMSNMDEGKFNAMAAAMSGEPSPSFLDGGASDGVTDLLGNGMLEMPTTSSSSDDNEDNQKNIDSRREVEAMAAEFKTYLAENQVEDKVRIEVTDQYLSVKLDDSILFESGRADLKPESFEMLNILAQAFAEYKDSDIRVEGHADNRPISFPYANNWVLSFARAEAVGSYFINNGYVEASRLEPIGYGEQRPVASNDTPEGRALNRRVEIKIMSSYFSGEDN